MGLEKVAWMNCKCRFKGFTSPKGYIALLPGADLLLQRKEKLNRDGSLR